MADQPSSLLHAVEIVHWVALAVMAVVYTLRVRWLLSFRATRDRQAPGAPDRTDARRGALASLGNVAMPWAMESTRRNPLFYATFVLFHLGVATGIALAFTSTVAPELIRLPAVAIGSAALLGLAFLIACSRIVRRLTRPHLRLISSPDDYFSIVMLTAWFALALGALAEITGFFAGYSGSFAGLTDVFAGETWLISFLLLTSFFLLYVPFSKISHYLYYPFTRVWLGRTLGHRGTFPLLRA